MNRESPTHDLEERLERGELVFYETCPFPLPSADDLEFLRQRELDGFAKSITLFPGSGLMGGQASGPGEETDRLRRVLEAFSREATSWLAEAFPRYRRSARFGPLRLRIAEEKGREFDPRLSGSFLHVDANSDQPAHGSSFLRIFVNINPDENREWITSSSLGPLLEHWGDQVREPGEGPPGMLDRLRIRFGRQLGLALPADSSYDRLMMRLHFFGKTDPHLQHETPQTRWVFPPGSAWLVFSDLVSHAVAGGRFAVDQTYLVPPHAFRDPARSTRAVIERFWAGRPT